MGYGGSDHGPFPAARGWMEANDRRLIGRVERLDAEAIVAEAEAHQNACGAGAIAAAVQCARDLGCTGARTLAYTTSADAMSEPHATRAVGYAGILFERKVA
jgi:AmmeMemoRadiSam system protein B